MVPRSRRLQVVRVVHTIRSKGATRVAVQEGKLQLQHASRSECYVPPAIRVGPKVRIHFVVSTAGGSCGDKDM